MSQFFFFFFWGITIRHICCLQININIIWIDVSTMNTYSRRDVHVSWFFILFYSDVNDIGIYTCTTYSLLDLRMRRWHFEKSQRLMLKKKKNLIIRITFDSDLYDVREISFIGNLKGGTLLLHNLPFDWQTCVVYS